MARFSKSFVVEFLEQWLARASRTPEAPDYLPESERREHEEREALLSFGEVAATRSLLAEVKEAKRFSRKVFAELIQDRIDQIQEEHGFDYGNGYAQVQARQGGEAMWKDYGRYYALRRIADSTDTEVEPWGVGFSPVRISPRVTVYRRTNHG
jgi:hypothetical protein